MKRRKSLLSLLVAMTMLVCTLVPIAVMAEGSAEGAAVYYVALDGQEGADGSEANPFPTLEAARDHIRLAGVPEGGVTVYVREGTYRRSEPFVLTAEDSGTAENPVVYAAYPGETVSLLGSQALDAAQYTRLSDMEAGSAVLDRVPEAVRENIYAYNLTENGINAGETTPIGMGTIDNTIPEVLLGGKRMNVARYPNEEFMQPDAVTAGYVTVDENGEENLPWDIAPIFRQDDARYAAWALEDDAWLRGYFRFDWADEMHKIVSVQEDAEQAGSILLEIDEQCKYGTSENPGDIKYYGYNMLCELDSPYEYYIDRSGEEKILYVYLEDPTEQVVITFNEGAIIDMQAAEYITLQGFAMGENWQQGVVMIDCVSCTVLDCEIFRTGQYGVQIGVESYDPDRENDWSGGRDNLVQGCKIYDTGMGGVICAGGNYDRLENANNAVIGCEIYDFSQNVRTYTPAVNLYGVGNIARGNTIYNAPHDAIQVQGNNMLIEHNDISNVLTETGDAGVIYSGRSWVRRGNVIRYNYIHDIPNVSSTSNAIYLDDAMSGWEVYGNVIHNMEDTGSLYGGGRDLTIYGNVYINLAKGAYKIDDRTLTFLTGNNESLKANYEDAPIDSEAWKAAYPALHETLGHLDIDVDAINAQPDAEKDALNPIIPANISIQDEVLVNTDVGSIAAIVRRFGSINLNPRNYAADDAVIDAGLPAYTAVLLSDESTEEEIEAAKDAFLATLEEKPFAQISRGTPTVDAVLDDLYADSAQMPLDENFWYWGDEAAKKDPDNGGYYTMLWDDEFLYVYVMMRDEEILTAGYDYVTNPEEGNPWQNDVVEVFADGYKLSMDAFGLRCFTENDKFDSAYLATMQRTTALLKDGEVVKLGSDFTPEELVRGFAAEDVDAYVVEFALPLATILGKTPIANADAIMVKIQINDALSFTEDGANMWISDNPTTRILVLGGTEAE